MELRVNCVDIGVTFKVLGVERENTVDAVNVHGGHEPCVMHLNPGNAIVNQQPSPLLMDR